LPSLLERPGLLAEPVIPPLGVALDLLGHPLRRRTHRPGLFLRLREDRARLLLGHAPLLTRVALDRVANVARVVLRVGTGALRLARQLFDPGVRCFARAREDRLRLRAGVPADLLRRLLGRPEHAGHRVAHLRVLLRPLRSGRQRRHRFLDRRGVVRPT
jgi:hypothetical protein